MGRSRHTHHSHGSEPAHSSGGLRDDQRKHEEAGLTQGGHASRAEEWRDPQASAEGEPEASWTPETPDQTGTPVGMSPEDVELRSELARFLGKEIWPATRGDLLARAEANMATDRVLDLLRSLPEDHEFANLQDVAQVLGIATEQVRS
jgi:hypothetical protein